MLVEQENNMTEHMKARKFKYLSIRDCLYFYLYFFFFFNSLQLLFSL